MPFRITMLALTAAISVALAGCNQTTVSPSPPPPSPQPSADGSAEPSAPPTPLTVGLGFIPSVQFAPFYRADQAGYYEEAGVDVTFQNKIDPDLVTLVGQGAVDVGLADGTSVIPAVSNGIPIKYVATIYGRFPSVVFAKASSGIAEAKDLAGKKLGIPGRFGSSWIMLQALLRSANLTPGGPRRRRVSRLRSGRGRHARARSMPQPGFVNNEPVQLRLTGEEVNILRVDEITPLPGNGLIVGASALDAKRDAITGFVAATLRAMEEITETPEVGLEAALIAVPELASQRDTQAAILDATIEVWRGPVQERGGLGAIEPTDWEASLEFLTELGLVPNPVTVDDLIDTGLQPGTG